MSQFKFHINARLGTCLLHHHSCSWTPTAMHVHLRGPPCFIGCIDVVPCHIVCTEGLSLFVPCLQVLQIQTALPQCGLLPEGWFCITHTVQIWKLKAGPDMRRNWLTLNGSACRLAWSWLRSKNPAKPEFPIRRCARSSDLLFLAAAAPTLNQEKS